MTKDYRLASGTTLQLVDQEYSGNWLVYREEQFSHKMIELIRVFPGRKSIQSISVFEDQLHPGHIGFEVPKLHLYSEIFPTNDRLQIYSKRKNSLTERDF